MSKEYCVMCELYGEAKPFWNAPIMSDKRLVENRLDTILTLAKSNYYPSFAKYYIGVREVGEWHRDE